MYSGKTHALFLRYAVPQMIGLLFNSVYTIVDGVFIGNRLGRDAMAAAAVAVPFIEILISMAIAVAAGAGVIITTHLSRGEKDKAREIFNTAVCMLALAGILISFMGNVFLNPLASLLGATPEILNEASAYLWYIVTFSPFQLLSFLLGGMVRNDGRPKLAMTAMILGAVSNIILDYVFMYPFAMGIRGAALATALGPIFSVFILMPHFLLKKGSLYFTGFCLSFSNIKRILFCGFPSFIMEFSIGIVTFVYNFAIVHFGYGETGLAAYLMIGYIMLILLTLFLGMAEGLQPVFSYFMASGQKKKKSDMRRFASAVFLCIGLVSYIIIVLFGEKFFLIFTPDDLELAAFASSKCAAYFCGFFLAGYNILMISFWQATACTKTALLISLLRSLIFTPVFIMALPDVYGNEIIWCCQSISEAVTFLFLRSAQSVRKSVGKNRQRPVKKESPKK